MKSQRSLVRTSRVHELLVREAETLLVDVGRVRAPAAGRLAADVGPVRGRDRERHELVVVEYGHVDRRVGDVRSGEVRIVRDEHVALCEVPAPLLDAGLDGVRHRAEEDRDSGRLRPEQALGRYEPEAEVLHLVEQRVVGRSDERLVHLEGGRRQPVPNDLGGYDVDGRGCRRGGHRLCPFSRTRSPSRSARTRQLGGTTIVVVHSSTIAGPSITWSRATCSRSKTGVWTKPSPPRK